MCIVHSLQLQLLLCSLAAVLQPLHEAAYRLDTQLAHSAGQLRHARLAHAAGTLCWHSELALEALQLQLLLVLFGLLFCSRCTVLHVVWALDWPTQLALSAGELCWHAWLANSDHTLGWHTQLAIAQACMLLDAA